MGTSILQGLDGHGGKRLMKTLLIFLFVLFLASPSWGANCGGETPCACGDTVTSSYTLTGNLSCTNAGNALNVGANDITIDLGGYTIDGNDTNTVVGVYVLNYTGVTVQNGTITDFTESGINFEGTATGGAVINIASNSHGNQGFDNKNTASTTYTNISAANNVDDGFSMSDSSVAVINGATFTGNNQQINIIEDATLTGSNITISHSGTGQYGIWLTGQTGTVSMTLTDVVISGTYTYSIYNDGCILSITDLTDTSAATSSIYSTGTITIIDADLSGTYASHVFNQASGVSQATVKRSRLDLSNTTESGIYASASTNVTAISNIITGMAPDKYALAARTGATVFAYGNTITDSAGSKNGRGFYNEGAATIKNNIFQGLAVGITAIVGSTQTVDYNCFYDVTTKLSGTITSTNEVTTDPLFVSTSDFRLRAGSPCIDAGTDVGLTSDYAGVAIPLGMAPDIGAHEWCCRDGSMSTGMGTNF